jgi:hypothetical protein
VRCLLAGPRPHFRGDQPRRPAQVPSFTLRALADTVFRDSGAKVLLLR